MAILLDSASIEDAQRAAALGFVTGITTNPALIARTGRPGLDVLGDLLSVMDGPVCYQVTAEEVAEREAEARQAAALAPDRVVIKIPSTTANYTMAAHLVSTGIRVAFTAVTTPMQAYLAGQVGAEWIITYVNRLTRQVGDGLAVLREQASILQGSTTRLLAASLKSIEEVQGALLSGAHDVTVPLNVLETLGDHPLSDLAIRDFAAALRAER